MQNLKKNSAIRNQVIFGQISPSMLPKFSAEQLQTDEKKKEQDAKVKKLQDLRQLDWETKNESKINDMCGIKGDWLKASLFTCGRCKSTRLRTKVGKKNFAGPRRPGHGTGAHWH